MLLLINDEMFCFQNTEVIKMLVDLGKDKLEGILKDGVREMIGQIGGKNRQARKQKNWYTEVKGAINEYQRVMKEEFLPVLVDDFSRKNGCKVQWWHNE